MMSIAELHKHRMRTQLPQIEAVMTDLIKHVRFLCSTEAPGPHALMTVANSTKTQAIQLRLHFLSIVSQVGSLKRMGDRGDRAELRAHSVRLEALFAKLQDVVARLDAVATDEMNKPGRYGEACAQVPINAVVEVANILMELVTGCLIMKVRERLRQ